MLGCSSGPAVEILLLMVAVLNVVSIWQQGDGAWGCSSLSYVRAAVMRRCCVWAMVMQVSWLLLCWVRVCRVVLHLPFVGLDILVSRGMRLVLLCRLVGSMLECVS